MGLLALVVVIVGVGVSQLAATDKSKRVGETVDTATFRDVTVSVPAGWSVVQLSQKNPCPPVQDETIIIATDGLGGDCKSGKSSDSLIWITALSPLEVSPPTTTAIGNTTGWAHEQVGASNKRWVVAVPKSNLQIAFTGPIDDQTRQSVIDSIHKS
jgi:hypothetical protein